MVSADIRCTMNRIHTQLVGVLTKCSDVHISSVLYCMAVGIHDGALMRIYINPSGSECVYAQLIECRHMFTYESRVQLIEWLIKYADEYLSTMR